MPVGHMIRFVQIFSILYFEYNVYLQTLIVTGGSDEFGTRLDSTEVYNLDSTVTEGAWREVGRLPSARCQ